MDQANLKQAKGISTALYQQQQQDLSSLEQQPTFRKSVVLEQENQELKGQIELLKAALLGLCKDQKLEIPGIMPLFQQQMQANLEQITSNLNQMKQSSSKRGSPQRKNQKSKVQSDIFSEQENNENNYSKCMSILSHQSSPIKSTTRRKRQDRKQSQIKFKYEHQKSIMNESQNYKEFLPLQIKSKKFHQAQGHDDTLNFDKSIDTSTMMLQLNYQNKQNDLLQQTPQLLSAINQDSLLNCSTPQINDEQDNDECSIQMNDQSQLKIKYAKMLEELEQDSPHFVKDNDEQQVKSQLFSFDQIKPSDVMSQNIDDSIQNIQPPQMEVQIAAQFEQKQFYEQEINNLKSQLEMFSQEEQKLLSLFSDGDEDKNKVNATDDQISDQQYQTGDANIINPEEQEDILNKTPDHHNRLRQEIHLEDTIHPLSNTNILRNLQQMFLDMKDTLENENEESFIKPVKIISPPQEFQNQPALQQYPEVKPQTVADQEISQIMNHGLFSNRSYVSPTKYKSSNLSPDNKQNYPQNQIIASFNDSQSVKGFQINKEIVSFKNNSFIEIQQDTQKAANSDNIQKPRSLSKVPTNKHLLKRKTLNQTASQQSLHKSSSQISIRNIFNHNTNNQDQISYSANVTCTTPRNIYNIGDYNTKQTQSIIDTQILEDETFDGEIQKIQTKMQSLELMAKRKSLAEGLIQQEEPNSSSDEDDNTSQKFKLNLKNSINPYLKSENDEVKIDLTGRCDSDLGRDYIELGENTCMAREKEDLIHHIYKRKTQLDEADQFFGVYSVEKSEQLKNQRNESIKKAEALLSQYLEGQSDYKKYTQIAANHKYEESIEEPQVIHIQQHSMKFEQIQNTYNDISFQQESKVYEEVKDSNRNSIQCNSNNQFEIDNQNTHQEKKPFTISLFRMDSLDQEEFDEKPEYEDFSDAPFNIQLQTEVHQIFDAPSFDLIEKIDTQLSPQTTGIDLFNPQSFMNRGKSQEASTTQSNQRKPTQLQLPSKRPIQIKKTYQYNAESLGTSQVIENQQSNFQSFQQNSISCDKNKKKATPLSKTIEKFYRNDVSSTVTSQKKMLQQKSQKQITCIEDPVIFNQNTFIHNQIDPEYYYNERSKSVIKRRDELMRKKQQEIQQKLDQKLNKVEQLQRSVRPNQHPISATRAAHAQNQKISDDNHKSNVSNSNIYQNHSSYLQNDFNSRQKSTDSQSQTPIKKAKNQHQKHQYNANQNNFKQQKPFENVNQNTSQIKSTPKDDKKTSTPIRGSSQISFQSTQQSHLNSIIQTPISGKNKYIYQQHSTIQNRTSTSASECASYRQYQNEISNITNNDTSQSRITCNLIHKQQNQQTLKNNIINRTVRLNQGKPKEYIQLKKEQKMKQVLSSTLEQLQFQKNHALYQQHLEHSLISNNNTQQSQVTQASFTTSTLSHYQKSSMIQQPTNISKSIFAKRTNNNNNNVNQQQQQQKQNLAQKQIQQQQVQLQQSQQTQITQKSLNSSRSTGTLNNKDYHNSNSTPQSNYCTTQKIQGIKISDFQQMIAKNYGSKDIQQQQNLNFHAPSECENCLRLISKGLSTNFCLEHFGTPRCIDD